MITKRTSSNSSVMRLLTTLMALAIAATVTALASSASPAGAIAPNCYATVQGTAINASSSSNCYYVVVRQADWKKVCEGTSRSLSCKNLNGGKYQVQTYSTSPWKKLATNTVTISGPVTGGGCDKLAVYGRDIAGGHVDGSCYYVVTNTSTWSRACAGTVFRHGCAGRFDDLARGTYKVDVYSTRPWKKLPSHYLTIR